MEICARTFESFAGVEPGKREKKKKTTKRNIYRYVNQQIDLLGIEGVSEDAR